MMQILCRDFEFVLSLSPLTKQFRMRAETHKFDDTFYFVIPNEKIIPFYMTLHIVLPFTL